MNEGAAATPPEAKPAEWKAVMAEPSPESPVPEPEAPDLVAPGPSVLSPGAWRELLEREHARTARSGIPATVVVVELVGLRELARRVGVAVVEERVVPPVTDMLHRSLRASDSIARVSPNRFHVLLPEANEVGAAAWATRVELACDDWMTAGRLGVRLKTGAVELRPDRDPDATLAIAVDRVHGSRRSKASPEPGEVAPVAPEPVAARVAPEQVERVAPEPVAAPIEPVPPAGDETKAPEKGTRKGKKKKRRRG